MDRLSMLVDATLAIEKPRVAIEVRQSHLTRQGRSDPETDELHRRIKDLEGYVDGRIATLLSSHPAYSWFHRVKGIGKENIGKVIGQVRVKPERNDNDEELPYADTISALWKFAGFAVENGRSPRREKGEKLTYNAQLRSMCWRLGSSIQKAGLRHKCPKCGKVVGAIESAKTENHCPCGRGTFEVVGTTHFSEYYLKEKNKYVLRYVSARVRIVPAEKLPKDKNGKRYEPEGVISEGHVHNQALRKMIKLFLACLWLVWREAEGLPVTKPYAIDKLGHDSFIDPWSMTDR